MITRRFVLGGVVLSPLILQLLNTGTGAASKGEFRGRIIMEWLPDGRRMKVIEALEFVDPKGRRWPVPESTIVDGASIPQVFWSIIGGPFEGPYRNASVVHDHFCETRTRRAQDVHRVFHEGMLASGVSKSRAWLMYKAVDKFGPTWDDPKIDPKCEVVDENFNFERCAKNAKKPVVKRPTVDRDQLLKFADAVKDQVDSADFLKLRAAIDKI